MQLITRHDRARLGDLTAAWGVLFAIVHASSRSSPCSDWPAQESPNGDGAAGVATTLYFLVGGVLFSVLGRRGETRRMAAATA